MTVEEMVTLRDALARAISDATTQRHMAVPRPVAIRSEALEASARGQGCTLRLPGVCNHDTATTVLCHLPGSPRTGAKGVGSKAHDTHAVYACSNCHDYIDGRRRKENTGLAGAILLDAMVRGLDETHFRMVEDGLISVKGHPK